jgi:hypothetical protein
LQQELDAVPADPSAPADQRARVDRQLQLQVVEAAEHLPIGVLDPAFDHLLVGQLEGVLEVAEPDHQPDRHAGPAQLRVIELAEAGLEHRPVDQSRQPHQRVAQVDLLTEARAPKVISWFGIELDRLHRNRRISTPGGQFPATAIFGNAQNSLTSNNLLIFQTRLVEGVPGATVDRNSVLPEKVPAGGLVILRDGDADESRQALGSFAGA